jgi:hypothetical protein
MAKKVKTEADAATEFTMAIIQQVPPEWPSLCKALVQYDPVFATLGENIHASYAFALAVFSVQMRALPNVLKADQAQRIRSIVVQCLHDPERVLGMYDTEWDKAVSQAQSPLNAIAAVLYARLGLSRRITMEGREYLCPTLLLVLSGVVVKFGGAWWKQYVAEHEIVSA